MLPLAVYGTLRSGEAAIAALGLEGRMTARGPCVLHGILIDFGEWPGLVDGDGRVCAELFEIADAETLAALDAYEGFSPDDPKNSLYLREVVQTVDAGEKVQTYIYNQDRSAGRVISSGDWFNR